MKTTILPLVASLDVTYAYCAAALASAFITLAVCYGISKVAAHSAEAIARQPETAEKIQTSSLLPLLLLEGIGMIAVLVCALIVLLK